MSDSHIVSDHYGARRPGRAGGSLTPTAAARTGSNIQGGVQFSQRQPHQPSADVSGAPMMRSNHYGGRALHAAPAPLVSATPVLRPEDLDEIFGSDLELDAEIDALLGDD